MPNLCKAGQPYSFLAQAHGTKVRDRYAGTLHRAGFFSTHDRKLLATGEGGFVLTDDEDLAERIDYYTHLGHLKGHVHGVVHPLLRSRRRGAGPGVRGGGVAGLPVAYLVEAVHVDAEADRLVLLVAHRATVIPPDGDPRPMVIPARRDFIAGAGRHVRHCGPLRRRRALAAIDDDADVLSTKPGLYAGLDDGGWLGRTNRRWLVRLFLDGAHQNSPGYSIV